MASAISEKGSASSVERAIIAPGAIRMQAGACAFLLQRLKPGIIYTAVSGSDKGDLGTEFLDQIRAEFARFRQPLTWFVDASHSPNVVSQVLEGWIGWLTQNQHIFKSIHVFSGNKAMNLNFSIARHLSSTSRLMVIEKEQSDFEQAIKALCPEQTFTSAIFQNRWLELPGLSVSKDCLPDGTIKLSNEKCCFTFKRIDTNVVLSTIGGVDDDTLGNYPLDFLRSELALCTRPLAWFVDASATNSLAPSVPETWAYWIANNQKDLDRVVLLTARGAVPLLIDIVKSRLKATTNIMLCQSKEQFESAIKVKIPDYSAIAVTD